MIDGDSVSGICGGNETSPSRTVTPSRQGQRRQARVPGVPERVGLRPLGEEIRKVNPEGVHMNLLSKK